MSNFIQNRTVKPVVLSQGIHSNLLSWQDFGKELAADGQDVWLIEMVGGPYTDEDCDVYNCPDYTFGDLKDYYWPALIAAVQEYSSKNKVDYVGYSLGCSAALESLESHQNGEDNIGYYFDYDTGQYLFSDLAANPVDTFVGMGCPGNFTELTTYMKIFNMTKEDVFQLAANRGLSHLTGGEFRTMTNTLRSDVEGKDKDLYNRIIWGLVYLGGITSPGEKMSINIYDEFFNWINDPNQPNLGSAVNLNNTLLIQGKAGYLGSFTSAVTNPSAEDVNSDTIVPNVDMKLLCNNVNSSNKNYVNFNRVSHAGLGTSLPDKRDVKDVISDFLKDKTVNGGEVDGFTQDCSTI